MSTVEIQTLPTVRYIANNIPLSSSDTPYDYTRWQWSGFVTSNVHQLLAMELVFQKRMLEIHFSTVSGVSEIWSIAEGSDSMFIEKVGMHVPRSLFEDVTRNPEINSSFHKYNGGHEQLPAFSLWFNRSVSFDENNPFDYPYRSIDDLDIEATKRDLRIVHKFPDLDSVLSFLTSLKSAIDTTYQKQVLRPLTLSGLVELD